MRGAEGVAFDALSWSCQCWAIQQAVGISTYRQAQLPCNAWWLPSAVHHVLVHKPFCIDPSVMAGISLESAFWHIGSRLDAGLPQMLAVSDKSSSVTAGMGAFLCLGLGVVCSWHHDALLYHAASANLATTFPALVRLNTAAESIAPGPGDQHRWKGYSACIATDL